MPYLHTPECVERLARSEREQAAWRAAHPGACEACGGWGGTYYPGHFNPRDGGTAPEFDECPSCLAEGRCPLCGAEWDLDNYDFGDEAPCGHKLGEDGAPGLWECCGECQPEPTE